MSDPMDELIKLRDAIDRVAADLHLKRESCGFVPADDKEGIPNHVIATFSIHPDIVLSEQERIQRDVDAQFGDIIDSFDGPKEDPELKSLQDTAREMLEDDDWDGLE